VLVTCGRANSPEYSHKASQNAKSSHKKAQKAQKAQKIITEKTVRKLTNALN
jgi:hypothetical protein